MENQTNNLISIFSEKMDYLRGNPYVAFMFQQIDCELQTLINNKKDSDDSGAYDLFDLYNVLSFQNDSLWFSTPENPQFREHVNRIFKELPVEDHLNPKDSDNEESWMLKRIKSLKIDFAQKLNDISEERKIPLSSIVRIYHIFLYGYYFYNTSNNKEDSLPRSKYCIFNIEELYVG